MEQRLFNKNYNLEDFRSSNNKSKKKSSSFKDKKNNVIHSLNDVECFLNNFNDFKRYIHLYKFFRKK